jgi:acetyl-CoA C-acetyltransferase
MKMSNIGDIGNNSVYILDYCRTPIGSLMGTLGNFSAVDLGTIATNKLLDLVISKCPEFSRDMVERVYFGNVMQSGSGQNVARQISKNAGIEAPSVTINVVCGSGMESLHQGYQAIMLNEADVVLVGGTESMSNVPHLSQQIRKGCKYGNISLVDGILCDGLIDAFSGKHMGELTEDVNSKYGITREMQDDYARMSYTRARGAVSGDKLSSEIVSVEIIEKNIKRVIDNDEEVNKVPDLGKLAQLKPAFSWNGTITPGNASKLNDGACAMIIVSQRLLVQMNLKPIARILGFDMSVGDPTEFSRVPIRSVERLLSRLDMTFNSVDLYEINEAFSSVPVMFHQECGIEYDRINIYGGAVALGHPIGCSGARIVGTLLTALHNEGKRLGCASICNGGGGAISVVVEMI